MADTQELDLDVLHQSIIDAFTTQFPSVVTVDDYRDSRSKPVLPAIFIELSEMDASPEDDPATEQQPMMARFEARLILPGVRNTKQAKREIRKLAAAVCAFLRENRFGMGLFGVGPAEVLGAYPDEFDPELDQYEVWRVEWQQLINLGVNAWYCPDGILPTTVYVGFDPFVGTAWSFDKLSANFAAQEYTLNEDKYTIVYEAPANE